MAEENDNTIFVGKNGGILPILNLTQHNAVSEQMESGVVEPTPEEKAQIKSLLTFEELPTRELLQERAEKLAQMVAEKGYHRALIGGAPYFMPHLERALKKRGITPLYAFSKRESVERTLPDGSVQKVQVFKHLGFVEGSESSTSNSASSHTRVSSLNLRFSYIELNPKNGKIQFKPEGWVFRSDVVRKFLPDGDYEPTSDEWNRLVKKAQEKADLLYEPATKGDMYAHGSLEPRYFDIKASELKNVILREVKQLDNPLVCDLFDLDRNEVLSFIKKLETDEIVQRRSDREVAEIIEKDLSKYLVWQPYDYAKKVLDSEYKKIQELNDNKKTVIYQHPEFPKITVKLWAKKDQWSDKDIAEISVLLDGKEVVL